MNANCIFTLKISKIHVKSSRKKKNKKSMSLPSITETKKNATLLRIVTTASHYTATSPHFCSSRPEAGGRHPQLTARPMAPDLFGTGATSPEFYKLSNFNHGSGTTYSIDDEPKILLFYSCRQPQHQHNSNFYIMECLGLMAAIPR